VLSKNAVTKRMFKTWRW